MGEDELLNKAAAIVETAMQSFRVAIEPLIVDAIQKVFGPGGELYEEIVEQSQARAVAWYDMYDQKYYKRGYTFKKRYNIQVNVEDISVSGESWECSWSVENLSPHAHWSDGFAMRNGLFRPGGPIVVDGENFTFNIKIDSGIAQSVFQDCLRSAMREAL